MFRPILRRLALAAVFFAIVVIAPAAAAADDPFKARLPRIKPHEPKDALKTFVVAPGFRLEQAAAEPLVHDPIAMAFDAAGRLFVVEMRGYSEHAGDRLGRISRLVDVDGDGRYDRSTIYAKGLSWPSAVTCYDGGIFVAAAPDLIYFKDTTGDGRADVRRVAITGFGRSNVQGLVNCLRWSLDSRIHGATSSNGYSNGNRNRANTREAVTTGGGKSRFFNPFRRGR